MRFNPPLIPLRFRQENEIYYVATLGNKFYKKKGKNEFLCIFIALPSCHPHHVHWHRRAIVVVAPLLSLCHCVLLSLLCRRAVAVVHRAAACHLHRWWCVGITLLCVTPGPKGPVDGGGGGCYWCLPIVVAVGVAQCHGCWWVAHSGVW